VVDAAAVVVVVPVCVKMTRMLGSAAAIASAQATGFELLVFPPWSLLYDWETVIYKRNNEGRRA
jgi:hypothetical protein